MAAETLCPMLFDSIGRSSDALPDPGLGVGVGRHAEPQVPKVADASGGELQAFERGPAGPADAQVQSGAV